MAGLADFRKQHPEYNDMRDTDLGDALHAKFYSDMPKADFDAKMGLNPNPVVDAARSLPGGLAQGVTGTIGFPSTALNFIGNKVGKLVGREEIPDTDPRAARFMGIPTIGQADEAVSHLTGGYYQPQTTAGRYAETAASFAPALFGGEAGIGSKLMGRVLAPAAGSQAAGAAAEAADVKNPYLRGAIQTGGAVLGGGAVGGARALGAALKSSASPEELRRIAQVKALQDYGVQPSIGQVRGGALGAAEEKLNSIPVIGSAIKNAQVTRPTAELNRGVYQDVLSHIDDSVPKDLAIGRPSVNYVNKAVGDYYDELLPKMSLPVSAVKDGIDDVLTDATTLGGEQQKQLGAWAMKIQDTADHGGTIGGKDLKGLSSDLRKAAFSKASDPSSEVRDLSQHLFDLHDVLMDATKEANPEFVAPLSKADAAYTKLIRLNKAAGSTGAVDGVFTPAQLNNAVLTSVSKRNAARASGNLPMQEISDAAQSILKAKVPNSGTTDRSMLAAALIGAPAIGTLALSHPFTALGAAAGIPVMAATYARPAQRAIGNALMNRAIAVPKQIAPNVSLIAKLLQERTK